MDRITAKIALWAECLKAATAGRTSGTTTDTLAATAVAFWDTALVCIPELHEPSDTPLPNADPKPARKDARAAGATGKEADRASRAALPPIPEN